MLLDVVMDAFAALLSDAQQMESVTTKQHLKNHLMIKNRSHGSVTTDAKQSEASSATSAVNVSPAPLKTSMRGNISTNRHIEPKSTSAPAQLSGLRNSNIQVSGEQAVNSQTSGPQKHESKTANSGRFHDSFE